MEIRFKTMILMTLFMGIVLFVISVSRTYADDFEIVISEVMFNSACEANTAANNCGTGTTFETQFEWVEIFNKGNTIVDLTGWQICDIAGCDALSGSIAPGAYILIAQDSTFLGQELANYGAVVNGGATIFLASNIGDNGLANGIDSVYLLTDQSVCGVGNNLPCVSDCISWHTTAASTCAGLVDGVVRAYLTGSDGVTNSSLATSEQDGQSIVNVAGTWYQSGPGTNVANQASPYATNVAEGGSPTAVTLQSFSAGGNNPVAPVGMLLVALALVGLWALKRRLA
jgi:hypothetical protein